MVRDRPIAEARSAWATSYEITLRRSHEFEDNAHDTKQSAAGTRHSSPRRARGDRNPSADERTQWRRSRAEFPLAPEAGRHQVPARAAAGSASGTGPAATFVLAS